MFRSGHQVSAGPAQTSPRLRAPPGAVVTPRRLCTKATLVCCENGVLNPTREAAAGCRAPCSRCCCLQHTEICALHHKARQGRPPAPQSVSCRHRCAGRRRSPGQASTTLLRSSMQRSGGSQYMSNVQDRTVDTIRSYPGCTGDIYRVTSQTRFSLIDTVHCPPGTCPIIH